MTFFIEGRSYPVPIFLFIGDPSIDLVSGKTVDIQFISCKERIFNCNHSVINTPFVCVRRGVEYDNHNPDVRDFTET